MRNLLIVISCLTLQFSFAQHAAPKIHKPAIDFDYNLNVYPKISDHGAIISSDGKYAAYIIENIPEGSQTLFVQSTETDWKRVFQGGKCPEFTEDSQMLLLQLPGDSLCFLTLGKEKKTYIPSVISFQLAEKGKEEWLAYKGTDSRQELVLMNLKTNHEKRFDNVDDYTFNKSNSVLLLKTVEKKEPNGRQSLVWVDLNTLKENKVWSGENAYNYLFDKSGEQLAFIAEEKKGTDPEKTLWYYHSNGNNARLLANEKTNGVDSSLTIDRDPPVFSVDGKRVFFKLIEKNLPKATAGSVAVDVWNYKDPLLQSAQLLRTKLSPQSFEAVVNIAGDRVIRLKYENEIIENRHTGQDSHAIVSTYKGGESWWNPAYHSNVYLESTVDGSRKLIKSDVMYINSRHYSFSPGERWLVYFDQEIAAWFSYDLNNSSTNNITGKIPFPVYNENTTYEYAKSPNKAFDGLEAGGWLNNEKALLIYDNYDIWQVDPSGIKQPINITKGYGRSHHIKFRITQQDPVTGMEGMWSPTDTLLLSAFNTKTKYNGLYRIALSRPGKPELLNMGPYILYTLGSQSANGNFPDVRTLIKAKDTNTWIVSRRSATASPNLFITKDFRNLKSLSDLQPQKAYNWLTTELVHWTMQDGKPSQGILYKPEDFDPKKKYPLIFYYYQQLSDNLFDFPESGLSSGPLNIPYFVSRGYLVFEPDIYYQIGHPGQSAVSSVVSAAKYLVKRPYIDARHMGIHGHSFGGFETNYLVTHTQLFAAASEAAGMTNFISGYLKLSYGLPGFSTTATGFSSQVRYELGQNRMGATLWQRPDLYLENSAIMKANQVTTPLLMMYGKRDGNVDPDNGIEFFNALRRLGKRVWLLQYDNGVHAVGGKDALDYTIRLTQFFDHYLKNAPPPVWMTEGIPARLKGIKTGYELDFRPGAKP